MDPLQSYIEINKILSEYSTQFGINENSFLLNGHFLLGLIMIVLASWLRFRAKDNLGRWEKANKMIERSFEYSDPPIVTTRIGCIGWLFGRFEQVIFLSLLIIGLDQIFFDGIISISIASFAQ